MDSDFHTLEDLGTGRGKGLGCLSYGGEGEAEGLYVGHLSAGEKGGGLVGVGGGQGEAVGDAQQQVSPLCWESHL